MPSSSPDARICIFAPHEEAGLRVAGALLPSFAVRQATDADQISQDDDVIFIAGWKRDALKACAEARTRTNAPVVLLAHDGSSRAVVEGLRGGADLVVFPDADPAELAARIRAILRRYRMAGSVDPFHALRLSDSAL
ncbi:MAG: hypothetical protein ACPL7R_04775 [Anaerolineae bacterium]